MDNIQSWLDSTVASLQSIENEEERVEQLKLVYSAAKAAKNFCPQEVLDKRNYSVIEKDGALKCISYLTPKGASLWRSQGAFVVPMPKGYTDGEDVQDSLEERYNNLMDRDEDVKLKPEDEEFIAEYEATRDDKNVFQRISEEIPYGHTGDVMGCMSKLTQDEYAMEFEPEEKEYIEGFAKQNLKRELQARCEELGWERCLELDMKYFRTYRDSWVRLYIKPELAKRMLAKHPNKIILEFDPNNKEIEMGCICVKSENEEHKNKLIRWALDSGNKYRTFYPPTQKQIRWYTLTRAYMGAYGDFPKYDPNHEMWSKFEAFVEELRTMSTPNLKDL